MEVRFWAATDTGRTRDHNEDNFLVDKKLNLFIVADGMGGHAAGEVASSVAVREVRRVIAEQREVIEAYSADPTEPGREAVLRLIESAIETACSSVYQMAQENPEQRGMGTTLDLMIVAGDRGFIGHVGDSRVYLARASQVHQVTEDHSLVNELIKRGRLKPGDAFDSPYKNAVTRAVGVYESVEVDTFDFDVLPGDNFLLCSDGLSCYLDDDLTHRFLSDESIKDIPGQLIDHANECGGKDNITAVVVRMVEAADEDQADRMADVRHKLDTLRAIPLFKYLTYKGLVKVMNITNSQRFKAGELLFEEGARGESFYIILDGRVRLSKANVNLAELGPGGHFGEMAMVDKAPRSARAVASVDGKALVLQREAFYELMRRDPVLSVKLMWSFIQVLNIRLRITNQELIGARNTIDGMRRTQADGLLAQMPSYAPNIAGIAAMPVAVTDELIPGFLFAEPEAGGTDPLLKLEPTDTAGAHGDLDLRPGLDPSDGLEATRRSIHTEAFDHPIDLPNVDDVAAGLAPTQEPAAVQLLADGSGDIDE